MKNAFMVAGLVLSLLFAAARATSQSVASEPAIALVGGTLIDVSSRGHSTRDIANAVVIVRAGRVEAAGSAVLVKVPKDAKRVDCSGTYILPGLVDGFGGLNSQAQANAWLYMGVTTIVGLQDERRGMLSEMPIPVRIFTLSMGQDSSTGTVSFSVFHNGAARQKKVKTSRT